MKLFTADIDKKLFAQYLKGSDLANQVVVAKIFNPYGRGTWYLLNSDPEDPEYLWAIVDMDDIEVGSVNRSDLENIRIKPFMLGLERDLSFTPMNAAEIYRGLNSGKQYATGGGLKMAHPKSYYQDLPSYSGYKWVGFDKGKHIFQKKEAKGYSVIEALESDLTNGNIEFMAEHGLTNTNKKATGGGVDSENKEMVLNNNKQIAHHTEELSEAVKKAKYVPAWVVAKVNRSASDLSDATHYMEGEGESYANGGGVGDKKMYEITFEDVFSFATAVRAAQLTDSQYQKAIQQMKNKDVVIDKFNEKQGIREQLRIKEITPKFKTGGGTTKKEFVAKKVEKVMHEFKQGDLHSGKNGKIVKNPKQAIAIALSEGKRGWKHKK